MKMLTRAGLLLSAVLACSPALGQVIDLKQHPLANSGAALTGTLATSGNSAPIQLRGDFNFSLWGTFAATCTLERSFDGTVYLPLTALGTAITWTAPASETISEPEYGVSYHVKCPTVTSGTVSYRLSQ